MKEWVVGKEVADEVIKWLSLAPTKRPASGSLVTIKGNKKNKNFEMMARTK